MIFHFCPSAENLLLIVSFIVFNARNSVRYLYTYDKSALFYFDPSLFLCVFSQQQKFNITLVIYDCGFACNYNTMKYRKPF